MALSGEEKPLFLIRRIIIGLLFLQSGISSAVVAQEITGFVAIVMDDLGNDLVIGEQVIAMPYDLTYSFLPHTKYSLSLSRQALKKNKEIMLHLPMEPINNKNMGPGGLNVSMPRQQFVEIIRQDIQAIPGVIGINNHMGSLLTQNSLQMQWLMEELKGSDNFYFVDSRTHSSSVAADQARAFRVPTASRDIFLDHVVSESDIDFQFQRILKRVNNVGYALAIGHPHKITLDALKSWLPRLKAEGIKIVSVSRFISLKESRRLLWQASLSRSHKVVKN
ncbi:MAG: divergent polysaccharide deacetylase family protein [Gammaproteobacteria bacterium]|nr:divergent polysaccharide deacetylase family protein [Gammaproteobacteria bacterium]